VFENVLKKDLQSPEYIGKGKAKAAYIQAVIDEDEASGEDDSLSEDDEMEVEENMDKEEEGEVDGSVEEGDGEEDAEGEREDDSGQGKRCRRIILAQVCALGQSACSAYLWRNTVCKLYRPKRCMHILPPKRC
jgi:hypothetical protein